MRCTTESLAERLAEQDPFAHMQVKEQTGGPAKFFYNKETFTGTHTKGGPQAAQKVDMSGQAGYSDLAGLTNRDHVQNDAIHRKKGDTTAVFILTLFFHENN